MNAEHTFTRREFIVGAFGGLGMMAAGTRIGEDNESRHKEVLAAIDSAIPPHGTTEEQIATYNLSKIGKEIAMDSQLHPQNQEGTPLAIEYNAAAVKLEQIQAKNQGIDAARAPLLRGEENVNDLYTAGTIALDTIGAVAVASGAIALINSYSPAEVAAPREAPMPRAANIFSPNH